MNQESTALAPVMPVNSMADLAIIGKTFASSGMFGCTNEQQGTILALTCMTERISPLKFNQTYHIIEGKPSMRADAMLAKFKERGGKFVIEEKSEKRAAIRLIQDGNDYLSEITLDQAMAEPFPWYWDKKDGKRTLKTNWATPRSQKCMLWARAVSDGVRTVDPGVNMGVYTPEEVQDFSESNEIPATPKSRKQAEDTTPPMKTVKGEVVEPPKSEKSIMAPGRGTLSQEEEKGNLTPKPTQFDFSVFPAGKLKGQKFEDVDSKMLEFALTPTCTAKYPEFQEGHCNFIKSILMDRAAAKDAPVEGNEPFPEE